HSSYYHQDLHSFPTRRSSVLEGDGVPETAARIDAAVEAGDLERALAEYDSLPEASKTAGAAFMDKVRARHTADRLGAEALAAALDRKSTRLNSSHVEISYSVF